MKDKTREALANGEKAKRLLENGLLNKWWEDVNTTLNIHMRQTPITDTQRIMELKALMDAMGKMKKDFQRYVMSGDRAKTKLGNKTLKEKLRRRIY
jgi:hypothetical protein